MAFDKKQASYLNFTSRFSYEAACKFCHIEYANSADGTWHDYVGQRVKVKIHTLSEKPYQNLHAQEPKKKNNRSQKGNKIVHLTYSPPLVSSGQIPV